MRLTKVYSWLTEHCNSARERHQDVHEVLTLGALSLFLEELEQFSEMNEGEIPGQMNIVAGGLCCV